MTFRARTADNEAHTHVWERRAQDKMKIEDSQVRGCEVVSYAVVGKTSVSVSLVTVRENFTNDT